MGSSVFVISVVLLGLFYVVLPVFSYRSALIPASCADRISNLPSDFNYTVPGVGSGTLLASDAESAVVAVVDHNSSTFNSTVLLVNKTDNQTVRNISFGNDILGAAVDNGILYMFNDKILYMIDMHSGQILHSPFESDNYRGVYASNNALYMQTNVEITAIGLDGSAFLHLQLSLRSIANGCFVS